MWKIDSPTIVINGRSILRAIIFAHVLIRIHNAISVAEQRYYCKLEDELKRIKKEQKISKKKQKVESN